MPGSSCITNPNWAEQSQTEPGDVLKLVSILERDMFNPENPSKIVWQSYRRSRPPLADRNALEIAAGKFI